MMCSGKAGYGSHSFLNEYIIQNRCKKILEIGVADGENARTMIMVASRNFPPEEVEYYGFDTFEEEDDPELGLAKQKLEKIGCRFTLFKGDSVATFPKALRDLPMMDLIFIDGGHSYVTVKRDRENSKLLMHDKTGVFFRNYDFSGPRKVIDSISREEYSVKIIHPFRDCATAFVRKKT